MTEHDQSSFTPDEISDWFWSLIERAEGDPDSLRATLEDLSSEDLVRFEDEFQHAAAQIRARRFQPYLHPDLSEDGAQDVANFVVSQGRAFYTDVWRDPSHIPARVDEDDPRILSGIAGDVHYEKFDEEIEFELNHEFKPYLT